MPQACKCQPESTDEELCPEAKRLRKASEQLYRMYARSTNYPIQELYYSYHVELQRKLYQHMGAI